MVGPLLLGHATTFHEGAFTVDGTARVIAGQRITNFTAAPTVYRLMMAAGDAAMAPIACQLRVASSAGEPLNPEVVRWAERVLRVPLKDHYGQTETLMTVVNHHSLRHTVKLGAAGLAMPGFSLAILDDELRPVPPDTPGVLAVHRKNSPLFPFDGYWHAETPAFQGDWYLTGDTMQQDAEGHFFFVGRNDDMITSAGYRIGPFDVESVIIEHPAVAEVAVVGKPDPERTEIVKAFVVLRPGIDASDALKTELQQHVRTRPLAPCLSARDRVHRGTAEDAERQGAAVPATTAVGSGHALRPERIEPCGFLFNIRQDAYAKHNSRAGPHPSAMGERPCSA